MYKLMLNLIVVSMIKHRLHNGECVLGVCMYLEHAIQVLYPSLPTLLPCDIHTQQQNHILPAGQGTCSRCMGVGLCAVEGKVTGIPASETKSCVGGHLLRGARKWAIYGLSRWKAFSTKIKQLIHGFITIH